MMLGKQGCLFWVLCHLTAGVGEEDRPGPEGGRAGVDESAGSSRVWETAGLTTEQLEYGDFRGQFDF